MFEPEELMARIADLESQLKVSEMAPPAAEQLIACLESEIAKRDARIVGISTAYATELDELAGRNYAQRMENAQLRAELAAIKAQEPAAWIKKDVLATLTGDECCYAFGKQSPAGNLAPLYASPVPEAKAQGVVMPERASASHGSHDHQSGWNACIDEVARLNDAPSAPEQ